MLYIGKIIVLFFLKIKKYLEVPRDTPSFPCKMHGEKTFSSIESLKINHFQLTDTIFLQKTSKNSIKLFI